MHRMIFSGMLCCALLSWLSVVVEAHASQTDGSRPCATAKRSCVRYKQTARPKGLNITLRNVCSKDVSCTVSWTLRCPGEVDGGSGQRESSAVDVKSGTRTSLELSAKACGDGAWQIEEVAWVCRTK